MQTTESRGALATDQFKSPEEETSVVLNRPVVALLAAGAIGLAVGAVVWQYRRRSPGRFGSFDRAVDIARSGAVDTVNSLKRRLRAEGYSPSQIEGSAKRYLAHMIDAVRAGIR